MQGGSGAEPECFRPLCATDLAIHREELEAASLPAWSLDSHFRDNEKRGDHDHQAQVHPSAARGRSRVLGSRQLGPGRKQGDGAAGRAGKGALPPEGKAPSTRPGSSRSPTSARSRCGWATCAGRTNGGCWSTWRCGWASCPRRPRPRPTISRVRSLGSARRSARQRHELRAADLAIAGDQRDLVHEARGGDQLVSRIALEIEAGRGPSHGQVDGPDGYPR